MDWTALSVSLRLAALTSLLLLPVGVWVGRWLAFRRVRGRPVIEALLALPLVLPPTVLGYYLLVAFGGGSRLGQAWKAVFGHPLAFSFEGLLLASLIANLPFAIQPMQRGFEAVPTDIREAAAVSGFPPWRVLRAIDLPLAWPGIVTGMVLTFAHTVGEFGVVLMVGGSIPGETRTVAIALYDRVQAFDMRAAGVMAAFLLLLSLAALAMTYTLSTRIGRRA
ncbi:MULTISPECIES: molybdate ABC transporter permease subunit [Methylobacteriaceae]|uniref:molybdate ABC transporter permease subunit n=1 Tax=Methylobacteriaceae TaxID=119045 RepID=UPI001173DF3C|nr:MULTISPECIES: molybdate ABC transporter permease subunit [Methylobacteriaceae]GEL42891.1 molybdenum ABC transporter permease subunit [Methylorubrum extorquens]